MHLTLKKEATKPAAANFLQQQARFDYFTEIFNNQRPHEALDMKCPAEVYQPSTRAYTGLPDVDCPFHDKTIVVTNCGRICLGRKKINFSTVFAGQAVGIKEVHDDIWLVSFMDYDCEKCPACAICFEWLKRRLFKFHVRLIEPFSIGAGNAEKYLTKGLWRRQ